MTLFITESDSKWYVAKINYVTKHKHEWEGIPNYDRYLDEIRSKNREKYQEALKNAWNETNPLIKAYLKIRGKNPELNCSIITPESLEQRIEFNYNSAISYETRFKLKPEKEQPVDKDKLRCLLNKQHFCRDLKFDDLGFGNEEYKNTLEEALSDSKNINADFVSVSEPKFYKEDQFNPLSRKIPIYVIFSTSWEIKK